ncbi:MAG: TIGR00282 family metallophosphoesterase [Patescibacteria group bacterium]
MIILFIGDIVGKPGRHTVAQVLPQLKNVLQPDIVIANVENLAHGKGLTTKTWEEIRSAGVDVGTGGNHTFSKDDARVLLADTTQPLVRPANFLPSEPGRGAIIVDSPAGKVRVLNLIGQSFMKDEPTSPFTAADTLLTDEKVAATFVDIHAEASSEKVALGWYLDGRVSVVVGTHTHIPTADARILPGGTAYITDVGMCGLRDGIIGVDRTAIMPRFLGGEKAPHTFAEHGPVVFNAIMVEVGPDGHATSIVRVDRQLEV